MLGFRKKADEQQVEATGFDAYDLRLGDLMRGERATQGKSLLDVQRELKIKAAYIAAIENCDPTAFDTPGFIAGYVRSYSRYLGMDPDWAFATFCRESGFRTAHGMSPAASGGRATREERLNRDGSKDIFSSPTTPFAPAGEAILSRIEPGALGSIAVLGALILALGYGGWHVVQEVQRVSFAPVEQSPTALTEVDPLAGGTALAPSVGVAIADTQGPSAEALGRLYRPQALAVPVMVPRDGPIADLSPDQSGVLVTAANDTLDRAVADAVASAIQVTAPEASGVTVVAVRPAWIKIAAADGTVIFQGILDAGKTVDVPQGAEAATMRVGESGSVYFTVAGLQYGPVGDRGVVTSNVVLTPEAVTAAYAQADLSRDGDLASYVALADASSAE